MDYVKELLGNQFLIVAFTAWFVAQFIKIVITLTGEKRLDLSLLISSGGMPSSHSATVSALCVATGRICDFSSVEFAIALIFAFIVMYDAAGVRRAAGEHAKVINKIVQDFANGKTEYMEKNLKELIGHTPFQVFAGAFLGIITGLVFPL